MQLCTYAGPALAMQGSVGRSATLIPLVLVCGRIVIVMARAHTCRRLQGTENHETTGPAPGDSEQSASWLRAIDLLNGASDEQLESAVETLTQADIAVAHAYQRTLGRSLHDTHPWTRGLFDTRGS